MIRKNLEKIMYMILSIGVIGFVIKMITKMKYYESLLIGIVLYLFSIVFLLVPAGELLMMIKNKVEGIE